MLCQRSSSSSGEVFTCKEKMLQRRGAARKGSYVFQRCAQPDARTTKQKGRSMASQAEAYPLVRLFKHTQEVPLTTLIHSIFTLNDSLIDNYLIMSENTPNPKGSDSFCRCAFIEHTVVLTFKDETSEAMTVIFFRASVHQLSAELGGPFRSSRFGNQRQGCSHPHSHRQPKTLTFSFYI